MIAAGRRPPALQHAVESIARLRCRPVILESPLSGDVERNLRYLDACIRDSVLRGETPYASHRMLPGALNDLDPSERRLGMFTGFEMAELLWRAAQAPRVFCIDLGFSGGMRDGYREASYLNQLVRYRLIPGWWER